MTKQSRKFLILIHALFTDGTFTVVGYNEKGETKEVEITLDGVEDKTVEQIVKDINAFDNGGVFEAVLVDGAIQFKATGDGKDWTSETRITLYVIAIGFLRHCEATLSPKQSRVRPA